MSFTDDIRRFLGRVDRLAGDITIEATSRMGEQMADLTPYVTGEAKASWTASINDTDLTTVAGAGEASALDIAKGRIRSGMKPIKEGDVIHLSNNTEQAEALEFGLYPNPPKKGTWIPEGETIHGITGPGYRKFSAGGYSIFAPSGMARTTLQQAQTIVDEVARDKRKQS